MITYELFNTEETFKGFTIIDNGTTCVFQEYHPFLEGSVRMTEQEAIVCAQEVIQNINLQKAEPSQLSSIQNQIRLTTEFNQCIDELQIQINRFPDKASEIKQQIENRTEQYLQDLTKLGVEILNG